MKHGFYFRFYKRFHNELFCGFLANLAYLLFCMKFLFRKLTRKKICVKMTVEQAHNIIDRVYTPPLTNPEYINPAIDSDLDLSVVIPVYNYADILEENVKSILNQNTKYKYQVIFVDDGSTDGARDILKKYEENPKVKLIFQKNSGIGAARNTGINNASGKYLMFIDCDDTVHNDIIEVLMDEAYRNDYDMVMAAHNLVKEKDGKIYNVIPNIYPNRNLVGYKNGDDIMNLAGLPWGKVYKRELWNDVRFFPGYWYEDTIIQFLIFTNCKKYSYLQKIEYEYRWYEKNFSHTQGGKNNIKAIDSYGILLKIIEKYIENGQKCDEVFYTLLLRHLSTYYYSLFTNYEKDLVEALFTVAVEMIEKYKPEKKVKLPYILRQVEKSFYNKDIELWKLASCYQ